MDRRQFIKMSTLGAMASAVAGPVAKAATPPSGGTRSTVHPDMKYRLLGSTGEMVSLIGIGGFHLARPGGPSADEAVRLVRRAVDGGVTFCDNSWDYNGGESEIRLGRALADGYRDKVFLMTKIDGRDAKSAASQLDQSLQRLGTDHLDLLQFHEVIRLNDAERIFAQGGALEAVLRAREQGKLRHIGFTGHKSPDIHRHMFEVAKSHGFHFDSVQMPLNVMDAHYDSFERTVVPIAQAEGTAILGMKPFGDHFILDAGVCTPMELLHYPMSLPVSVVITGIDSAPILEQALDAVRSFHPLADDQRRAILAKSAAAAGGGGNERYKTSHHFDSTVQHPEWLG